MPPSTNPRLVNSTGIKPLASEFATDPDMRELIAMFVSEMPEKIQSIETLWSERQLEPLKRVAHQLKGAGGGYGYAPISSAAGKLEDTIKSVLATVGDQTSLISVQRQVEDLVLLCRRVSAGA